MEGIDFSQHELGQAVERISTSFPFPCECYEPVPKFARQPQTMGTNATCPLCYKGPATVGHVLTGCSISLHQGRYTWRHNACIRVLLHFISKRVAETQHAPQSRSYISFVKAGDNLRMQQTLQTRRVLQDSFLCPTSDWILEADIPELPQMVFPAMRGFILRPDIILYSTSLHRVVIYEHTCPNEQRILTSSVLKRAKYSKFCLTLAQSGWDVHMHTGEASALGFVSSGV